MDYFRQVWEWTFGHKEEDAQVSNRNLKRKEMDQDNEQPTTIRNYIPNKESNCIPNKESIRVECPRRYLVRHIL